MNIHTVFFNSAGRLRSGWRVSVFLALFVASAGVLGGIASTILRTRTEYPGDLSAFAIGSIVSLVVALVIGWLTGRRFEDLPYKSLGAAFSLGWFKNLCFGLLVGAASLSFAVLIAFVFGGLRFEFSTQEIGHLFRGAAITFVVLSAAAAFEEAFFRGYMFQTLTRAGLAWLAIVLTAAFFGAVHLGNPDSGIISTVDTIVAGVLFGIAYLKTRDLWFPFGIHLMWNWMQGAVFGIEISGLKDLAAASILKEVDSGPAWLTGGSYGIEGGIASTIALIVTCAAIYVIPFVKPDPDLLAISRRENPKESES